MGADQRFRVLTKLAIEYLVNNSCFARGNGMQKERLLKITNSSAGDNNQPTDIFA